MGDPSPAKRPRVDAGTADGEIGGGVSREKDGSRALLRSALGSAAAHLAQHSAVAKALVTAEEDSVDAAIACCTTLLREHAIGLDVAVRAITVLAALVDGDRITWRELSRLRDGPLTAALTGCDWRFTEQLHTIAEVLQFPKHVSGVLQRQIAAFRVRSVREPDTVFQVRAEAALRPLLAQAQAFVREHLDRAGETPCGAHFSESRTFWRGYFNDPEDTESQTYGRREFDHAVYAAGRLLAGRGLLPSVLTAPLTMPGLIANAAALVGDATVIIALERAGGDFDRKACAVAAASAGQVQVLQTAVQLGWELDSSLCVAAAAQPELDSVTRQQIVSILVGCDPSCAKVALLELAECGDVECVRWLLGSTAFTATVKADAAVSASAGGHISMLLLLLEAGASLTPHAFQASGDAATLQWFAERGFAVDTPFVLAAAASCRLFQLEWAASVADVSGLVTTTAFVSAARNGDIPTLRWLLAHGGVWNSSVLVAAYLTKQWSCFVFALREGCPLGPNLHTPLAAMPLSELQQALQALEHSGRRDAVDDQALFRSVRAAAGVAAAEWLLCDVGVPVPAEHCTVWAGVPLGYLAAERGCLRLLQYLCEKKLHKPSPPDMRAVLSVGTAARPGGTRSLEVVRWLHARGVASYGQVAEYEAGFEGLSASRPEFLASQAARVGALELLQVLVEECGAHWTEGVCEAAAEHGHVSVLRWAIGKLCPCAVNTWCAAVLRGGKSNDFRPLQLLHSAKRPWDGAVWTVASSKSGNHSEHVRAWLRQPGCPGSEAAGGAAAGAGAGAGAGDLRA